MAIPINTLDYARKLEELGVPRLQAEGQSLAFADALASVFITEHGSTAIRQTKFDAVAAVARLETKNEKFAVKASGKFNHIKWMFTAILALDTAIVVKTFLH